MSAFLLFIVAIGCGLLLVARIKPAYSTRRGMVVARSRVERGHTRSEYDASNALAASKRTKL